MKRRSAQDQAGSQVKDGPCYALERRRLPRRQSIPRVKEDKSMTHEELAVHAVVTRFYDAIEHLVTGRGVEPMLELWHHSSRVTTAHPLGEWAYGWYEVEASWKVIAS